MLPTQKGVHAPVFFFCVSLRTGRQHFGLDANQLHEEDKKGLERFDDAVIDKLFVLNAKRAEEEKIKGLGGSCE